MTWPALWATAAVDEGPPASGTGRGGRACELLKRRLVAGSGLGYHPGISYIEVIGGKGGPDRGPIR